MTRVSHRAFTLVELLVVMSIIALLIGLLLPTLSHLRRSGRVVACGSNVRQLSLANQTYAQMHRNRFAPGASGFRANLHRWHGTRDSTQEAFAPRGGALSALLGPEGRVRVCPDWSPDSAAMGDFERGSGGYGYNNAYIGRARNGEDAAGVLVSAVTSAHGTLMFADAAIAQAWPGLRLIEYSFAEPPRANDTSARELDPSIHFRHRESASIAWVDGHVSLRAIEFTRGNIYGVREDAMRSLAVGWFGPDRNDWFDLD